jgi:hypothetical protein
MAVALWILLPLIALHLWGWRRPPLLRFQLLLDLVLAVVVGPALVTGGDLNPVRCLSRNRPFDEWQWSAHTGFQPTQSDLVLQFHPWWEATRKQLADGHLPLIASDIGGGLPLLANGQTGLWAPVMLPVWVLGAERGTTVMAAYKLELAGLGAFLLLWRGWRLRWQAAAIGGIAYGACPYQIAWLLVPLSWVTAGVPWLWWSFTATMRRRRHWSLSVVLGGACGWLLGCGLHPETAAVAVGSALLYGLILHPRRWSRLALMVATMLPVAVALAWPTLRFIEASARGHIAHSEHPNRTPLPLPIRLAAARQMLLPAINGHPGRGDWRAPFPHGPGALGIGGAALGLLLAARVRRRHRRLVAAAAACLAVAAVLAFRAPPLDGLLVRIPPLNLMNLPRFAALIPWALALIAALAGDGPISKRQRSPAVRLVPAVVLCALALASSLWELAPADLALVCLSIALSATVAVASLRPALLAGLVTAELACLALGINPVAASRDRLPRPAVVDRLIELQHAEGGRIMGLAGMLPANLATRYGLPDLRAYDPLRPVSYTRMLARLGEPEPVLGGPLCHAPAHLAGAWSVRFLLTPASTPAPSGWLEAWRDERSVIWRNPFTLDEIRVTAATCAMDDPAAWAALLADEADLAAVSIVTPGSPAASAANAALEVLDNTPARARVRTRCDGPCFVVLARPLAPGWRAAIDGARAPLLRANLAAMGVLAPTGVHEVEIRYRPWR